jgi:hypothetical protein
MNEAESMNPAIKNSLLHQAFTGELTAKPDKVLSEAGL